MHIYKIISLIFFISLINSFDGFSNSSSSSSSSEDEKDCKLENNDETQCKLENEIGSSLNKKEKLGYDRKTLKINLDNAIERDDIATIAVTYFLAKKMQYSMAAFAGLYGAFAAGCIVAAPFTLGTTMIAGVPIGALCICIIYDDNSYKKIKRKAKNYLRPKVSPEIFERIAKFSYRKSVSHFIVFLEKYGLDIEKTIYLYVHKYNIN